MRPQRPTSVLVISIFHFLFGGLGLLCGLIGLGGLAMGAANGGANPFGPPPGGGTAQQKELKDFQDRVQQRTQAELPIQRTLAPVNMVIGLLLSVLLIVSGVGLVQMKPFGWYGSVVYGVASLVLQIFMLLFNLLYAMPISQRILDEEIKGHPTLAPMAGIMQAVLPMTIGILVLGMIYPVIVLIIMARPNVRAAFRGELIGSEEFGRPAEEGRRRDDDEPLPPGYGGEPDDRIGPAPR